MLAVFRAKKALCIGVAAAVIIVAAALVWLLPQAPGEADGQKALATALAGQNIVVTVSADTLEDVYGYQFNLNYDKEKLEYIDKPESKIDEITMIFSTPMEGYELVGATMTGIRGGVSGRDVVVCEIVFTAKEDSALSDLGISISDISLVTSDLEFIEDIEGWQLESALQQ